MGNQPSSEGRGEDQSSTASGGSSIRRFLSRSKNRFGHDEGPEDSFPLRSVSEAMGARGRRPLQGSPSKATQADPKPQAAGQTRAQSASFQESDSGVMAASSPSKVSKVDKDIVEELRKAVQQSNFLNTLQLAMVMNKVPRQYKKWKPRRVFSLTQDGASVDILLRKCKKNRTESSFHQRYQRQSFRRLQHRTLARCAQLLWWLPVFCIHTRVLAEPNTG
eukprot:gb/GECG01014973.1/.p1 GENE.gb/GECG01014973.1/~~gb/GECG01014973.1/.p1  ORF type:complete len:220 (+),score=21.36 gb/GECG01014973.1/:1-660(+)